MTYQNIYTAVQNIRFDSSILATDGGIKDWIKAREEEIWQYQDWPLKNSGNYTVTTSGSTIPLPTAFTEFSQNLQVFNNLGDPLDYVESAAMADIIASYVGSVPSGLPSYWTVNQTSAAGVVTQVIQMEFADSGKSYQIRGWSGPVCRSSTSAYKLGTMSANTDLPWHDINHYMIVSGAIALGKQQLGDPTWQADEQAFQSGLQRLSDYILPAYRKELKQWSGNYSESW